MYTGNPQKNPLKGLKIKKQPEKDKRNTIIT